MNNQLKLLSFGLLLIGVILGTGGCKDIPSILTMSYDSVELTTSESSVIINELIPIINERYAPAKTSFYLHRNDTVFANALEDRLRENGYCVAVKERKHPLAFYYAITPVKEKLLVRIQIGETIQIGRLYRKDNNTLVPDSGIIIRKDL